MTAEAMTAEAMTAEAMTEIRDRQKSPLFYFNSV